MMGRALLVVESGGERIEPVRELLAERGFDVVVASSLEEALADVALEAVGSLASGVAHDFNNLLTAIRGHAELALMGAPEQAETRDDLERIVELVERAGLLTTQLLALGRKQVMNPEVVDLGRFLEGASERLRALLADAIELHVTLPAEPATVWADRGQLYRILANLAAAARHAMPDGGVLSVRTDRVSLNGGSCGEQRWSQPGEYVRLTVAHTGSGMPPETLARAFQPSFGPKQAGHGSGLGLAVAYGIARQHGGTILAHGGPSGGTTFEVYLPFRPGAEDTREGDGAAVSAGTCGGTILFADDEDAIRAVAVRQLRDLGYEVIEAADGNAAIEILQARGDEVDLAVLDVIMPGLDGLAVHQLVSTRLPRLKFLFVTGYSPYTSREEPASGLPAPVLRKPFGLAELAGAVQRALRSR